MSPTKITLRDGSGVIALKYIVEEWDRHGNLRVYFRRNGKRIRIREKPGTPEFFARYQELIRPAERAQRIADEESFRWLVEQFYKSAQFRNLVRNDQPRRVLDSICLKYGTRIYSEMEPRHIRQLRDEKSEYPNAANFLVKVLRQLFKWAITYEHAKTNPAKDVDLLPVKGDGFHTWTVEEIAQYQAKHPIGTKKRLALDLLLFTGVRRSDVVRLGKPMERAGKIRFTEYKNRNRKPKERVIPILPALRASLDAYPSDHLVYLTNDHGKPFTAQGFSNWFRKCCDEAGLPQCTAHGLRKGGATVAAERGATAHDLMAIYGWETLEQAQRYTKKVDRERLIERAIHLVQPEQKIDTNVAPFAGKTKNRP